MVTTSCGTELQIKWVFNRHLLLSIFQSIANQMIKSLFTKSRPFLRYVIFVRYFKASLEAHGKYLFKWLCLKFIQSYKMLASEATRGYPLWLTTSFKFMIPYSNGLKQQGKDHKLLNKARLLPYYFFFFSNYSLIGFSLIYLLTKFWLNKAKKKAVLQRMFCCHQRKCTLSHVSLFQIS